MGQEGLTHQRLGKASGQRSNVNWLDISEEQKDAEEAQVASGQIQERTVARQLEPEQKKPSWYNEHILIWNGGKRGVSMPVNWWGKWTEMEMQEEIGAGWTCSLQSRWDGEDGKGQGARADDLYPVKGKTISARGTVHSPPLALPGARYWRGAYSLWSGRASKPREHAVPPSGCCTVYSRVPVLDVPSSSRQLR